jgi:hypothetical protein
MASLSPASALRQILDRHAAGIAEEMERLLAESRERERQEFAGLREQDRQEFADSLEQARRELTSAAALERQQHLEQREHDHSEFTAALAEARQELVELRERDQQEFTASLQRERREFTDRLNQAVRRLRQAGDREDVAGTLVDAAAAFCGGAAWMGVADGGVRGGPVRGVPDGSAEAYASLSVPLASAAALAGAVESREPTFAAVSEGELSAALLGLPGHPTEGRVAIFPLVTAAGVPGLLYTWGNAQEAVLEMLTQVASAAWEIRTPVPAPPPPAPELVRIAAIPVSVPAAVPAVTDTRSAWDRLSADEQQLHLRAQRYARVQAAEMRLHEAEAVESGRAHRNLYSVLQRPIDQARDTFHQKFFQPCPSMVDYLHLELLRTLANDDAELLGKDYPGPLV